MSPGKIERTEKIARKFKNVFQQNHFLLIKN